MNDNFFLNPANPVGLSVYLNLIGNGYALLSLQKSDFSAR